MPTNNDLPIAPLNRQYSLRESVTESLRAAIIAGTLKEGTLYSAPALAAAFGVSATPVREAMMDLTREGLVETLKNKGFRITAMSERELDELTQIRLLLEPPVVGDIAGTVPPSGIMVLRSMADAIVNAAREGDLTAYLAADREFHAELLRYAGNSQLVVLATELRTRTRLYGLKSLSESNLLADSAQEHHELLDLIETGDGTAAASLMRRHIGHARGLWATGQNETQQEHQT
ncbi:DNA-binding GntR family transcriptional regulator [Arthrobacter sp. AG258]|uniref:GntR family transcriptional regulator n=1 Tax=Arthrobacter sp. AG258 TaxID=2183899 RepID=UPI00105C2F3C|nr:GntR family transcriptional regulator [Arthrobacter sp. AG258]TDT82132.1 DNA-binding GntR family transcriptional regulator [Arthrobacter sp. AG258]